MSSPMFGLPAHLPIGVDAAGHGPVPRDDPDWDHDECWCGEPGCTRTTHILRVRPVHKLDGTMYQVVCTCGYISPPGAHDQARACWAPALAHKLSKEMRSTPRAADDAADGQDTTGGDEDAARGTAQ